MKVKLKHLVFQNINIFLKKLIKLFFFKLFIFKRSYTCLYEKNKKNKTNQYKHFK